MYKLIVGLLACVVTCLFPLSAQAEKMRIGFVEQIDATVDVPDTIKQNLKEAIRQNLVNSGKFEVVDRNQKDIGRLFEEMKLSDERLGRVDPNDTKKAEFGKLAGMEYMVLVSINDFFSGTEASKFQTTEPGNKAVVRLGVNLRLLNASTSKIQLEKSVTAKRVSAVKAPEGQLDMELANKSIKALADKVVRQVMDEAYPVLILEKNGTSAFINRGKDSGIVAGDEMEVYVIKKVTDDGIQETVDLAKSVGKIKVTNVSDKTSEAEVVEDFGVSKGCVAKMKDKDQATTEDVAKNIEKKKKAEDW
ncbi:MAG: CsgG/HfaB family protein [Candidatus Omnitrophota bacterium]